MNIQHSRPNYINVPTYRNGIASRLRAGHKAYLFTCVDNDNTDNHIQFQVITPKSLKRIDNDIQTLKDKVFYDKYLYSACGLTTLVDEITDIDEIDTSMLYVVS